MTATVVLWGSDHPTLGEVAVAELDERTALALSRGRFPKPYAHLDPNEDAVLAAAGATGRLLAVADGHSGFDAARAALGALAAEVADLLDDDRPAPEALADACEAAIAAVTRTVDAAEGPRQASRTALTVALVTDRGLHVATFGDTVCVRLRGGRARRVAGPTGFLGPEARVPRVRRVRLRAGDAVAVASDGVTDYLGRDWPAHLAAVTAGGATPAEAARTIVEQAMAGGAGDHLAVAVLV